MSAAVPVLALTTLGCAGAALLVLARRRLRALRSASGAIEGAEEGRRDDLVLLAAASATVVLAADATLACVAFAVASALALGACLAAVPSPAGTDWHRRACFACVPLQYGLVAAGASDLAIVVTPIACALALPIVALAGPPAPGLVERVALRAWAVMACVYALSHVPALLVLDVRPGDGADGLTVAFLVVVTQLALAGRRLVTRATSLGGAVRSRSRARARAAGTASAMTVGALAAATLAPWTPFDPLPAAALGATLAAAAVAGAAIARRVAMPRRCPALLVAGASLAFAAPLLYHALRFTAS